MQATNVMNNLTISSGGELTDNGGATTITGDLQVNGIYSGSGPITLTKGLWGGIYLREQSIFS
jgi:hypothetical protein